MNQPNTRNFCIIAHIDHGKSTLADRLLEITGTVDKRDMKEQLLDRMDLEREKGITIKLQPVRMEYKGHELNLIDTPGHVDFSYEVSRSLEACETALLVVDATQGIQAQTLANVYLALAADLTIIPVLNKIDLPAADVERVSHEIITLLGCKREEILEVSAKTGLNVEQVLDRIVEVGNPPLGDTNAPLRALIFDSMYDDYRGVVLYVRIVDGELKKNDGIRMMAAESSGLALEIGHLSPVMKPDPTLKTGQIGYIVTNFKTVAQARVGDTVTITAKPAASALPGYKEAKPFVYAGIFPVSNEEYPALKDGLEKLTLNDAALQYELENSQVLGHGFRVGFLGLLHMDIVRERLERENNLELIITNPSTDYQVEMLDGSMVEIQNAADLPDVMKIKEIREPWIKGEVACPNSYVGSVLQLIVQQRGNHKKIDFIDDQLALINFEAPLANMLTDFYDQLKSLTSGYGSFNYELASYRAEDLVRLDFLVASERVDSLSLMVHRSESIRVGREIVSRLKDIIPKQLFTVAVQAAIGGKIIAREDIQASKKDVTGHLYGGDVSRKKKLWAKQKAGKARLKKFGRVEIPSEAFTVLLKRD
ncbi:MAG TPA: translation elongation factor 4 [Candidatus Saccharimonadales bacterium]|nr:translation elongation factor 4 [Candidatus Saccharimonadales bacterium]